MAVWLGIYIAGVIILTYSDAMLCFAMKRRFRMWASLSCGVFWPVLAPWLIVGMAKLSRNWSETDK